MTQSTDREAYTKGLRALADALDANPDLPMPYHGAQVEQLVFVKTKDEIAAYRRLMGAVEKEFTDSAAYGFEIHGSLHGLRLNVLAPRNEVCTRRVVGTRTEEVVEWDCHPLLADTTTQATS